MATESESTQRSRIQRSIDYIESHLTDSLTVHALADVACYSPSRFQQLFRQFAGVAVLHYIRQRRLTESKRDLISGRDSLDRVATKYGYQSRQAFARAFSRFHGISLVDYQRTHAPVRVFLPISVSRGEGLGDWPRLSESKLRSNQQKVWRLTLDLDMPRLSPEVVQFAIFDSDPIAAYAADIGSDLTRRVLSKTVRMYEDRNAGFPYAAAVHKCGAWDRLFAKVKGNEVYLLTGNSLGDNVFTLSSNAKSARKWVTTKVYNHPEAPVCWCLPLDPKLGQLLSITLDETNVLDLNALFETYVDREWFDSQANTDA